VEPFTTALTIVSTVSGATTYGDAVGLQAFLQPYNNAYGATTNGETVTFQSGGNILGTATLVNGTATLAFNLLPAGNYAFTAYYSGDAAFAPSLSTFSQADELTVEKASVTMGLTTSSQNGVSGAGQPVTLTATVSSTLATGIVTFSDASGSVGTGTLSNGVATLVLNGLAEGTYSFSANYSGDTNFNESGVTGVGLSVLQSTSLTLTTNPSNFAALNQPVTLTATLSPYTIVNDNTNGESVTFYNGATTLATAQLINGVANFSFPNGLQQGNYSLTAVFNSDGVLAGSTSAPLAFTVATVENFVVNYSPCRQTPHSPELPRAADQARST
jgi:hypothetical protein